MTGTPVFSSRPQTTPRPGNGSSPADDGQSSSPSRNVDNAQKVKADASTEIGKRPLSTWNLFTLSISMAGAQVAWTVELGYGTPFLLSLGLSEQLTSLVWLAGPISGLIAQPVIGAISDSSKSRYRRRYWIITSTAVLVLATLMLPYCEELAGFFIDFFGGGAGDWDPERKQLVNKTAIGIAVVAFYLLDFSLNALQASLRNLLLDVTPPFQLNSGNAWHGRMTHAGNILGYGFGFLPLAQLPLLRLLGGTHFRKFCIVAMLILVTTVWTTVFTQDEEPGEPDFRESSGKFMDVLRNIWNAVVKLPRTIRRVCYVQLFAYMGWFPFLFYSTTYIGQVMAQERNVEPDVEYATRMGYLSLLWFSIVAAAAGTLIPYLASRDARLIDEDEDEDAEIARLRTSVREWRAEAARKGEKMKLPRMPFMLRNIWTAAMIFFSFLTFMTFFVRTTVQAIVVVSLVGIPWAVACWVPFAIIMEFLKEVDEDTRSDFSSQASATQPGRLRYRTISTPSRKWANRNADTERQALLRRRSLGPPGEGEAAPVEPIAGGTVLGIHNLAIVLPQFLVAIISSAIFRTVDEQDASSGENQYLGKNGVAWVLRFGGLMALSGALAARMVPPTKTEKRMRRRLAEIQILKEQPSP